jgi:DNA-binding transcriptional ArsR family regulator
MENEFKDALGTEQHKSTAEDKHTSNAENDLFNSIADQMPDEDIIYEMSEMFKVFSDSTRVRILCALLISELTVGDITSVLNMNQSAISHQLRLLKQAKLVKFRRNGKNCVYSLADDHVKTIFSQVLEHIEE